MVVYVNPILPHVHLRGAEYKDFNFLEFGFRDARAIGAVAILEQPNPNPQLTSEERIIERIGQVRPYCGSIHHGIHIGLTNDLEQVENAFTLAQWHLSNISGVKAFWVDSTGDMGIKDPYKQKEVWECAKKVNYTGVFFQHCQSEEMFRGNYQKSSPSTHSYYQSKWSELDSVMTQIRNARDTGFKGIFYVAHVSAPETIDFLLEEKTRRNPFEIIIETTAHHEFLNMRDYLVHGNRVKMNPALREERDQEKVLEHVIEGNTEAIQILQVMTMHRIHLSSKTHLLREEILLQEFQLLLSCLSELNSGKQMG